MSARDRTRAAPATGDGARYDQAYFDKWYRHPRHRVKSAAELLRQVQFVVHAAEWLLGRPVKSVLDVGAGEGHWQPVLKRMRPRLSYDGVDPSPYAVARYGARRGLQQGGIERLCELPLRSAYDLVVCCGMLNYLSAAQFTAGMVQIAQRTGGVAYLEIFARGDTLEGDTDWPTPKPAAWYRRVVTDAGLSAVGMQCYVPTSRVGTVARMERGA